MICNKIYRNNNDVLVVMWKVEGGKVTCFHGQRWDSVYRFDKATAIKKVYAGLLQKGAPANCDEENFIEVMNSIWDLNTIC
ncbi:MAG: hypothetical protein PHS04_00480 [Tissierellia bacterium]|nr:hypothetical protein [Tissierellia bacterium]